MRKWPFIVTGGVVLALAGLVELALWGSHGNLPAFIAGQRAPGPAAPAADATVKDAPAGAYTASVSLQLDRPLAELPPEYLSFALDASQLVGGKWWDPKAAGAEAGSGSVAAPVFDLNRGRLDTLVQGLRPAYLRIGGSESDKIYYDMGRDATEPGTRPAGYHSVLTRQEWDQANAFAARNDLKLVFTLNAGPAARDGQGRWDPANAATLLAYTAQKGYPVAMWELGNELNLFWFVHGLRTPVSPGQYDADLRQARALVGRYTPQAAFAGQGSAFWPVLGQPLPLLYGFMQDYLKTSGDLTGIVSWHYYPQQSRRGPIASRRAYPGRLLDPANLDEVAYWAGQVRAWRDRYASGKPIWMGETGNAQFGGEPGLSDVYLGGLWWLDQLGLLARLDHSVVVRQTLAGSDYGMIDDATLEPRPDYWNSFLWKRLMGPKVYAADAGGADTGKLRVYAQSTPGAGNGVTVLAINLDDRRDAVVTLPQLAGRPYIVYEMTAPDILGRQVLLNGAPLALTADGRLPAIAGARAPVGPAPQVTLHPLSYTFVVVAGS